MGQSTSTPMATKDAQAELRALVPTLMPMTQNNVIRATEDAPPPAARELAISAQLFHMNPKMIEFSMIEAVVRRGYVDKLRILWDSETYTDFIPKITRTLSYADKIHSLELFSDQTPRKPILPYYSYPNVLDSLPARMPALTGLHIATTPLQTIHWDVIVKVLVRARNLKAIKLEGPQIVLTQPWIDYIPCNLHCLILRYIDIKIPTLRELLSRSGQSLRMLHIEHVTSCDRESLAQVVGTCVPGLQQLTIIIPDVAALELNNLELAGILDSAMAAPLLSIQYLYCAGLCVSDWAFLREKNAHGNMATVVPSLQKLILHTCRRVRPGGLTLAIAKNKLPKLTYLEAIWPMADSKVEDMAMLYHVCSERNILLSPAMTEYYHELNANLLLEEGLQDSRRWANQVVDHDRVQAASYAGHLHAQDAQSHFSTRTGHSRRSRRHEAPSRSHHSRHHFSQTDISDGTDDSDRHGSQKSHRSKGSHKSHRSRRSQV